VNHLLFWKQKRRIFLERKATFSLSQGDEATSNPRFNSPHLRQRFPQHNQQQLQHNHPRGHEDFRPPFSEHFNWKFEFLFVKLPDYFILKMWQNAKYIFYNMNLSFSSELQKTKPKQRIWQSSRADPRDLQNLLKISTSV